MFSEKGKLGELGEEERGRGEDARRRADSPPGRAEGEGTLLDPEAGPAAKPPQREGGT